MTPPPPPMSHDESLELAALYALDALTPDERAAVDGHLAVCSEHHSEFGRLGGVAPALAYLAEPIGAPAALKRRVLEAYVADGHAPTTSVPIRRRRVPGWMGWAAAAVAVVLIAALGVAGLNLRQQADQANQRADQMTQAIAAFSQPGSQVAMLHGSGPAVGISGFVVVPASGSGYMVMTDVPAAPTGMTYQAWYIVDGKPTSAGVMSAGPNGTVVESGMQPLPGTEVIAVTLEPMGGSDQPTSQPIITGDVAART